MLNDAHRGCLGVFFKVRFFDLPKDAFVEGTIRFGLPRQLQITDRCLIQRQRGLLLLMRFDSQIVFRCPRLLDRWGQSLLPVLATRRSSATCPRRRRLLFG